MSDTWFSQLQPASWRGVPLKVVQSTVVAGRRTALHEYPFRDQVWVEDLGLGTQRITLIGFLIGDDVYDQRNAMLVACNTAGVGTLLHPSLGSLSVALVRCALSESRDSGRTVQLQFEFIQAPALTNPGSAASTGDQVNTAGDNAQTAALSDFTDAAGLANNGTSTVSLGAVPTPGSPAQPTTALPASYTAADGTETNLGGTLPSGAVYQADVASATTQQFGSSAVDLGNDPSLAIGAASSTQPQDPNMTYGRYDGISSAAPQPASVTPASAQATLSTNRVAVASAAQSTTEAAGSAQTAAPSMYGQLAAGGFGGL